MKQTSRNHLQDRISELQNIETSVAIPFYKILKQGRNQNYKILKQKDVSKNYKKMKPEPIFWTASPFLIY